MDRHIVPGNCARLLNQLVALWHRDNSLQAPTGLFATLDAKNTGVLQEIVKVLALELKPTAVGFGNLSHAPGSAPFSLTARERDVLCWLAKGKSVADIGVLMKISNCTVRTYIQRSLKKLDVSNRTHAVTQALRFGLIDP